MTREYSCFLSASDSGLAPERKAELKQKESLLVSMIAELDDLLVAYSGGVDSSLLAFYARKVLGPKARIVIAVSPSLATEELDAARAQAARFDWNLIEIATDEVLKPEYQVNDGQRCYFCKSTLFEAMEEIAQREGARHLAYGANVSDLGDIRPGHRAAAEHKVLSPLQSAGLVKQDIRDLARLNALPSWNRPQSACLSSRFPTFERVTQERLSMVERAEAALHELGFEQVRVRFHGLASSNDREDLSLARIEIDAPEMVKINGNPQIMKEISRRLKQIGFTFVTLDLEGYRQGSGNVFKVELKASGSR